MNPCGKLIANEHILRLRVPVLHTGLGIEVRSRVLISNTAVGVA